MNGAPILILQMQRMGDLVLSFPLLGRLLSIFPDRPIWVVGEPAFYEPLMPLSPPVTYFGYEAAPGLRQNDFSMVINLSHRPEAAALAGEVRSEHCIGPRLDQEGRLFINGDWQLYRAALTHNNRFNLYHWADLNCLDAVPPHLMPRAAWPEPRPLPKAPEGMRVGLFLGASEPQKHPDAQFWASLAKALIRSGRKPALLGGKAEEPLGKAVADLLGAPSLNLCGRFDVSGLAHFLGGLDLFITPDTGPMHVAAWLGTPVLNLSLGPVNPWETGPFASGHHVLRAALDCAGCWRCDRERQLCREELTAARTASLVDLLLYDASEAAVKRRSAYGLELLCTSRGSRGLYSLESMSPLPDEGHLRPALSRFWQIWFGALFGFFSDEDARQARLELRSAQPGQEQALAAAAANFALRLARAFGVNPPGMLNDADFWKTADPLLYPFSGWALMYAQNEQGGRAAFRRVLTLAEGLADTR